MFLICWTDFLIEYVNSLGGRVFMLIYTALI